MKIFIAVANFNRGEIAKKCIYSLWKSKHANDALFIFDDNSTEYEPSKLFNDRCDGLIISDRNLGIHEQRRRHITYFIEYYSKYSNFDYLYLTDNDAYHDPDWREQILKISKESGLVASVYNSPYHAAHADWLLEDDKKKDWLVRPYSAGISMLLTRDMAQSCYDDLDKMVESENKARENNELWDWDFYLFNWVFKKPAAISRISYCEHIGAGGIHNQSFEQDRALNPTKFLKVKREALLRKLK